MFRTIALCGVLLASQPVSAQVLIKEDRGGRLVTYAKAFREIRDSGEKVVVGGKCASACTLVFVIIPRDRLCITPEAQFGFHMAYDLTRDKKIILNQQASAMLMALYGAVPSVQTWIKRKGGLTSKMKYLQGAELAGMFPACNKELVAQAVAKGPLPHIGAKDILALAGR